MSHHRCIRHALEGVRGSEEPFDFGSARRVCTSSGCTDRCSRPSSIRPFPSPSPLGLSSCKLVPCHHLTPYSPFMCDDQSTCEPCIILIYPVAPRPWPVSLINTQDHCINSTQVDIYIVFCHYSTFSTSYDGQSNQPPLPLLSRTVRQPDRLVELVHNPLPRSVCHIEHTSAAIKNAFSPPLRTPCAIKRNRLVHLLPPLLYLACAAAEEAYPRGYLYPRAYRPPQAFR